MTVGADGKGRRNLQPLMDTAAVAHEK